MPKEQQHMKSSNVKGTTMHKKQHEKSSMRSNTKKNAKGAT
jgi:hypothetical protein